MGNTPWKEGVGGECERHACLSPVVWEKDGCERSEDKGKVAGSLQSLPQVVLQPVLRPSTYES